MADSLTEFLGLLAHSKEYKGLTRCRSRKGVVGRHDIGMDLLITWARRSAKRHQSR
jgi:hypothetical protein